MTIYFNKREKNIRDTSQSYLKVQIQVSHCRHYKNQPIQRALDSVSLMYPVSEKGNFFAFSVWGSGTHWEGSC